MSIYTKKIQELRNEYETRKKLEKVIEGYIKELEDLNKQYVVYLEAQQLLASVSDANTNAVLDYITGVINRALGELFPYDNRRIFLEKKMFNGQHAHINVKLVTSDGKERDLSLQSGTGLRQVISFLFVVSLIEIRKGRRLLLMDELLSGLHSHAKSIIVDIMKIFAEDGFQFAMVEYGVDNFGKLYIAEKPDTESRLTAIGVERYENEVFIFNRPKELVDKNVFVEEY